MLELLFLLVQSCSCTNQRATMVSCFNGLMLLYFSTDTTLMSQRLQGNMQNISISLKELIKFDVIVQ